MAEDCVLHAEKTQLREIFGFQRIREGIYTSAEMDTKWTDKIETDFADWRVDNTPVDFQHLTSDQSTSIEPKDDELEEIGLIKVIFSSNGSQKLKYNHEVLYA